MSSEELNRRADVYNEDMIEPIKDQLRYIENLVWIAENDIPKMLDLELPNKVNSPEEKLALALKQNPDIQPLFVLWAVMTPQELNGLIEDSKLMIPFLLDLQFQSVVSNDPQ